MRREHTWMAMSLTCSAYLRDSHQSIDYPSNCKACLWSPVAMSASWDFADDGVVDHFVLAGSARTLTYYLPEKSNAFRNTLLLQDTGT